jgi:hypothetical protein
MKVLMQVRREQRATAATRLRFAQACRAGGEREEGRAEHKTGKIRLNFFGFISLYDRSPWSPIPFKYFWDSALTAPPHPPPPPPAPQPSRAADPSSTAPKPNL